MASQFEVVKIRCVFKANASSATINPMCKDRTPYQTANAAIEFIEKNKKVEQEKNVLYIVVDYGNFIPLHLREK